MGWHDAFAWVREHLGFWGIPLLAFIAVMALWTLAWLWRRRRGTCRRCGHVGRLDHDCVAALARRVAELERRRDEAPDGFGEAAPRAGRLGGVRREDVGIEA